MTELIIEKFLNVDDIAENLLPSFIREVENKDDPLSKNDVERYVEQLTELLNGNDIVTNDKILSELFTIFYKCLNPIEGTNTVRFICNSIVSDLHVEYRA